jgi:hypothetical protein
LENDERKGEKIKRRVVQHYSEIEQRIRFLEKGRGNGRQRRNKLMKDIERWVGKSKNAAGAKEDERALKYDRTKSDTSHGTAYDAQ